MSPRYVLWAVLLCGAVLRADGLLRPIDQPSWRECDLAAIARAYERDGLGTFFYPQVDWGGATRRFAETELPLPSWVMAAGADVTGHRESCGRWFAYGCSLLALGAIALISARLLGTTGAVAATLFFAVAPLPLRLSTSIQPDGPMLAAALGSAYFWVRFLQTDRTWALMAAAACGSFAVLLKAPAAQLAVMFLLTLLADRGARGLRDARVWTAALAALAPPILWYWHAHRLWTDYGNSLGMSNESHWVGLDFFQQSRMALGLGEIELFSVWTPALLPLAALALVGGSRRLARQVVVSWLAASALFLFVAARTTSDSFFDYYHVLIVPAVALVFGLGCEELIVRLARQTPPWGVRVVVAGLVCAAGLALRMRSLALGAALSPLVIELMRRLGIDDSDREPDKIVGKPTLLRGAGLAFLTACAVAAPIGELARWRETRVTDASPQYFDAQRMLALLTQPGELVATGSSFVDHEGRPVAYQASYYFYWLDRHGRSLPREKHNVAELQALARQGARYFVLEKNVLRDQENLADELAGPFSLLYDGDTAQLYDLQGAGAPLPSEG